MVLNHSTGSAELTTGTEATAGSVKRSDDHAALESGDHRSALQMIADCFRHQHPEAFGFAPVTGPALPSELRGARDEALSGRPIEFVPEEAMGHPDALRLRNRAAGFEWSSDI